MSLAVVWMLLFGPATEAATYVLIAVPSAYLLIAGWSEVSQSALRVVSTLTYLRFVSAHILNSWFPIKKNVYLIHAIRPCLTLCFSAALCLWWKRQLLNETDQRCNTSERSKIHY